MDVSPDHVVEEEPVLYKDLEAVREANIREKEAMWKALMAKQKEEDEEEERERIGQLPLVQAASRPKKKRKRAPNSNPADVSLARKSTRLAQKPGPVLSYHEEEEEEARGRSRTLGSGARARSRQLRPRRPKPTYVEEELEPLDSTIFCQPCGVPVSGGCAVHPPVFSTGEDLALKVEPSHIKKAGEGVINRGDVIPPGVLFGPYPGAFVPVEQRQQAEMSGNAWEINDPEGSGVLGFVDPGPAVDVNSGPLHWMVKVNCSSDSAGQNLEGFQWKGAIYYRVMKPIPAG